jgi:cellulose synthase (UDP-forming)
MPHLALLLLNATAITVGIIVMADPPPTWLSVGWASMHVLILGRMIVESVTGGRISTGAARRVADATDARTSAVTHRGASPARAGAPAAVVPRQIRPDEAAEPANVAAVASAQ